jgi:hypothetical protein
MEETNMLHCKWLSSWTRLQDTTSPVTIPPKPTTCADSPAQTVVSSMLGMETPQQKRPKYTRNKTGCMTCRRKKVKVCILPSHSGTRLINSDGRQCDERKPICTRCTRGADEVSNSFLPFFLLSASCTVVFVAQGHSNHFFGVEEKVCG